MSPELISPEIVQSRLHQSPAEVIDARPEAHASVALILEPSATGHSIFFIERAHRDGDPWSGQIAFPGGRREPADADAQSVAMRETAEEVGVTLEQSQCIGRLDDLRGRHGGTSAGMVISCFVFSVPEPIAAGTSREVHDIARVPITNLLNTDNRTSVIYEAAGGRSFPGIRFGDGDERIVWGLTYRFLRQFFLHLGHELPDFD